MTTPDQEVELGVGSDSLILTDLPPLAVREALLPEVVAAFRYSAI